MAVASDGIGVQKGRKDKTVPGNEREVWKQERAGPSGLTLSPSGRLMVTAFGSKPNLISELIEVFYIIVHT